MEGYNSAWLNPEEDPDFAWIGTGWTKTYLQPNDVLTYCSRTFATAEEGAAGPNYGNLSMFLESGVTEVATTLTINGIALPIYKHGNDMESFTFTDAFAKKFGEEEYGCGLLGGYNRPAVTKKASFKDDRNTIPYVSTSYFFGAAFLPLQGVWAHKFLQQAIIRSDGDDDDNDDDQAIVSTDEEIITAMTAETLKRQPIVSQNICPFGWDHDHESCHWSYEDHREVQMCYTSCFYMEGLMDPTRKEGANAEINKWDQVILWLMFLLMSYMVITWLLFKEKKKQKVVLALSCLVWLQTTIKLFGYIIYPIDDERYCKNEAVPYMHGFNYCAVSAMLNLGIIGPMFQILVACTALDVYLKVIYSKKNIAHYWRYYVVGSFLIAVFFKFIPVFIIGEAAGFDGINSCGYSFWLRKPVNWAGRTTVDNINPAYDIEMWQLLMFCFIEHLFWLIAVVLFVRIIIEVCRSMKRVHVNKNEDAYMNTMKQIRLVKTPVLMILFVSIVSALQFLVWDLFIIETQKYTDSDTNPQREIHPDQLDVYLVWAKTGRHFQYTYNGPLYYNLSNFEDAQPFLFTFGTIDDFTVFINYYNKLAMHLAFPLLLFLVFGMQKDTLELWKKKLGVYKMKKLEIDEASSSSSSSSSSSAYDWTIVQNNSRMKYLGLSRFFESSAPLAPSECEMTSGTWAKGCSSSVYMEPGKEKENVPAP